MYVISKLLNLKTRRSLAAGAVALCAAALQFGCGAITMTVLNEKSAITLSLEQPTFAISEGDLIDLGVSLSEPRDLPTEITVQVSSPRNDVAQDFSLLPPAKITIPAKSLTARFQMRLANDAIYEGTEHFEVSISTNEQNVAVNPGILHLAVEDDNLPPTVTFANATATTSEGGTALLIPVQLSQMSALDTIVHYTVAGTALSVIDHSLTDGSITIPAGSLTASLSVTAVDDIEAEATETIVVSIASAEHAALGATVATILSIIDNDLSVMIDQKLSQLDPTSSLPIEYDVKFSLPIDPTTFTVSDLVQTGSATGITWSLSNPTSDNQTYLLRATAVAGQGALIPSINAGSVSTADGAPNATSISIDRTVVYDAVAPSVTIGRITASVPYALATLPTTPVFNVTFSEPVLNFTASDIVNAGTATGITWMINTTDNQNFTLTVIASSQGSFIPTLAAGSANDAAGNLSLVSTSVSNIFVYGNAVIPRYTNSGRNWNDYVKNDGAKFDLASDTACLGSEGHYSRCLHAGEIRMVTLPGITSCTNVTAADALGAFVWDSCEVLNGIATVRSHKLAPGKGLRNLLDASAWKNNSVTVTGPFGSVTTTPEKWWTNPVVPLAANGGPSDLKRDYYGVSTIYTAATDLTTQGYYFQAQKMAVVTLNGAKITYAGGTSKNCYDTAVYPNAYDSICVINADLSSFSWFEMDVSGYASNAVNTVFRVGASNFIKVWNTKTRVEGLIVLGGVDSSEIRNFESFVLNSGLSLSGADGNHLSNLRMNRSTLGLFHSNRNLIHDMINTGNWTGLFLGADGSGPSLYNVVANLTTLNSEGTSTPGVQFNSEHNTVVRATIANNRNAGIGVWSGDSTVHNAMIVNNGADGINHTVAYASYSQIYSAHNGGVGIYLNSAAQNVTKFTGNLIVSNNGSAQPCSIAASSGAPLANNTCAPANISVGKLNSYTAGSYTLANSVMGPITTDTANGSDNGGNVLFPDVNFATFDWFNMENPNRIWARYAQWAVPLHADQRGHWWNAQNGRIWDWSLKSTDTVNLNRSGAVTTTNAALVNGAACPAILGGSVTVTDVYQGETMGDGLGNEDFVCDAGETCGARTFLQNAVEILDDDNGNENALCESNENCLYTPNFGAYQGHGDYTSNTCNFQNGTVSNVKMYAYPLNGR